MSNGEKRGVATHKVYMIDWVDANFCHDDVYLPEEDGGTILFERSIELDSSHNPKNFLGISRLSGAFDILTIIQVLNHAIREKLIPPFANNHIIDENSNDGNSIVEFKAPLQSFGVSNRNKREYVMDNIRQCIDNDPCDCWQNERTDVGYRYYPANESNMEKLTIDLYRDSYESNMEKLTIDLYRVPYMDPVSGVVLGTKHSSLTYVIDPYDMYCTHYLKDCRIAKEDFIPIVYWLARGIYECTDTSTDVGKFKCHLPKHADCTYWKEVIRQLIILVYGTGEKNSLSYNNSDIRVDIGKRVPYAMGSETSWGFKILTKDDAFIDELGLKDFLIDNSQ